MSEAKKELEEALASYKRQSAIAKEAGRKLKENHPALHNFERLCELEVDYSALLARHNALVEAVKKLRHANNKDRWDALEFAEAGAEVDRLMGEE